MSESIFRKDATAQGVAKQRLIETLADFILQNISTQTLRQMLPINQVFNPELLLHSTSTGNSI